MGGADSGSLAGKDSGACTGTSAEGAEQEGVVSSDLPRGDKLVWLCLGSGERSLSVRAADAVRHGELHLLGAVAAVCAPTFELQTRLPIVLHRLWH